MLHPHVVDLVLHLRRGLSTLPPVYAYGALAGILMFEGTGLPLVPFEPLFVATALLVARGQLHLWSVVLYGAGGDVLGNVVGYAIGATVGHLVLERYGPRVHLDPGSIASVQHWFWRFGGGTILIARFFGPIRTPAILLAGISRMPLGRYIAWCALADVLWVAAWQVLLLRFRWVVTGLWERFGPPAMLVALALGLAMAMAWWLCGRHRLGGRGGHS